MEPSRSQAKKGIVASEKTDLEFNEKQLAAHQFQLELTKEQNRHAKDMKDSDLGILGRFFGDGRSTQMFIALVSVFFGLSLFALCLYTAKNKPENATFWSENGSKGLAFAGTALGYIFGKMSTNSKR